jgi:hypothetical protein
MNETPKQSDQLPEEAPSEQVPDDVSEAGEGSARVASQQRAHEQAHHPPPERGVPDAADEEVGGG